MHHRVSRHAGFVLLLAGLAPSVRADATLRYHTDIQTSAAIPAAAFDQALSGMRDIVLRVKGTKAISSQGNLTSIMDVTTQDVILVDATHKRFAQGQASQFTQQAKSMVPEVPEQARAFMASMKTNLESHSTGRTATIQGIQADEHEFVLSIDMAMPGGPPTASPFMKITMQVWTAQPDEAQRVPALQEIKNYTTSASSNMNPVEMVKQILGAMPGMGDGLSAMMGEMTKNAGVTMRIHAEVSAPFLSLMSQQLPGQSLPAGLNPNAPLMQMNQEVVELSTASLDDSIFQVPQDYEAASMEEILRGAIPAPLPPPPTPPQFKQ